MLTWFRKVWRNVCAPRPSAYRIIRYRDNFRIMEYVLGPYRTQALLNYALREEVKTGKALRLLVRSRWGVVTEVARWAPVVMDPIAQGPVPPRDSTNGE